MTQLVDDGYHIVRLPGPVSILFSNSNSFYMDMLCIFYATRMLHIEFFFIKVNDRVAYFFR